MSTINAQEVASSNIPNIPVNDGFITLNDTEADKTQFQETDNPSIGKEHKFAVILHG
jgi:hypothetical protein